MCVYKYTRPNNQYNLKFPMIARSHLRNNIRMVYKKACHEIITLHWCVRVSALVKLFHNSVQPHTSRNTIQPIYDSCPLRPSDSNNAFSCMHSSTTTQVVCIRVDASIHAGLTRSATHRSDTREQCQPKHNHVP